MKVRGGGQVLLSAEAPRCGRVQHRDGGAAVPGVCSTRGCESGRGLHGDRGSTEGFCEEEAMTDREIKSHPLQRNWKSLCARTGSC